MIQLHDKTFKKFIDGQQIQQRIKVMASQINTDYAGKKLIVVSILNGAFMFSTDLVRNIHINLEVSFTKFSSYYSMKSSGKVVQLIGFDEQITDKDVLLVDDIIDTGLTMQKIIAEIQAFKPSSVKVASLLSKPEAMENEIKIDYLGFEIENKFVVGYGMDYNGLGRNLDDIYILT